MSVDLTVGAGGTGQQPSDDEVIAFARDAIEASREESRRGRDGVLSTDLQQPGVTVDLGHRNIVRLPDEVIDIIKQEIERLAISHNRVSSFPECISECKRLRYLNARHNALKEFPLPILQLSSLEILDLSKNRLKKLPEDISSLSSLKVLAIQRNRIEKLPLSLGDMTSLRMLKFDDNPIVFPPADILQLEPNSIANISANEAEAQLTVQIKKFLKQATTAATNRQRLQVESDSDFSEDAMETPRPPRPAGTRFPVRPSISGIENLGISSSISPEALTTPSLPLRSHRRLRSNQPAMIRRPNLLSPPENIDRSITNGDEPNDITVRPKRHGMVTPRIAEPGSLEQALVEPLATEETITEQSDESVVPDDSISERSVTNATTQVPPGEPATLQLKMGADIMHNMLVKLASEALDIIPSVDWGTQDDLRFKMTQCVDDAMAAANKLSDSVVRMDLFSFDSARQTIAKAMWHVYQVTEDLAIFFRDNNDFLVDRSSEVACQNLIWALWRTSTDLTGFGDILAQLALDPGSMYENQFTKYGKHSRQSHEEQEDEPTTLTDVPNQHRPDPAVIETHNASFSSSISSRSRITGRTQEQETTSTAKLQQLEQYLAEETAYLNNLRDGPFEGPSEEDIKFRQIVDTQTVVVYRCSETIPKAYERLKAEKDTHAYNYGEEHALTSSLSLLVARFENFMQAVQLLDQRLATINTDDKFQRTSKALWKDFRRPSAEWSSCLDLIVSLNIPQFTTDIKILCKPVHIVLKEAVRAVAESPWATAAYDNTRGPQNSENPSFYPAGSVPSTPMSAAIGPIASAAVNPGMALREPPRMASSSRINFFERADEYARNQQNRRI